MPAAWHRRRSAGRLRRLASLLSAVLMLDYLGQDETAARLRRAIDQVYADGRALTPDQGGAASTGAFCDALLAAI